VGFSLPLTAFPAAANSPDHFRADCGFRDGCINWTVHETWKGGFNCGNPHFYHAVCFLKTPALTVMGSMWLRSPGSSGHEYGFGTGPPLDWVFLYCLPSAAYHP